MNNDYSCDCNGASYSSGSSNPVSMGSSLEVSYSHSPSASQTAMYTSNNMEQGYSNLPAQLDYMISEALKDLKLEPNPENLPAVRSQITEVPSKLTEGQIIPVEPTTVIVPDEQRMMEQEAMKNISQGARRITLTEVEETLILKRRLRKISVSK